MSAKYVYFAITLIIETKLGHTNLWKTFIVKTREDIKLHYSTHNSICIHYYTLATCCLCSEKENITFLKLGQFV